MRAPCPFTEREVQILRAVADGLTCREIARALSISYLTVRKHRENILRKLRLHRTIEEELDRLL